MRFLKTLFLLVILLSLGSFSFAQEIPLVFATYRYSTNDRIKNIEPFAQHFGKSVNRPVKVVSYNSVHELIAGMQKGETDFVFINTFGYLLLAAKSNDFEIAAALHLADTAKSTYQTAIVSSKASGIKTFDELKTKASKARLLLVNPGSTSGNLIPRLKMAEVFNSSPEENFQSVRYTKNHALTLKMIADGSAEIGAFGSEEYYNLIREDSASAAKVELLWESPAIQLGPALMRKGVDAQLKQTFEKELLVLHETNKTALQAIKDGWTEAKPADRFQKVDDAYYRALIQSNPDKGLEIIKQFSQ
jgi:phosphonate transport system substrate-binding protein